MINNIKLTYVDNKGVICEFENNEKIYYSRLFINDMDISKGDMSDDLYLEVVKFYTENIEIIKNTLEDNDGINTYGVEL